MYTYNDGSSSTYLEIPTASLPAWLYNGAGSDSFIIGAWIRRPTAGSTTFRTYCMFQNLFATRDSSTAFGARAFDSLGAINTINVSAGIQYDNWVFQLTGWDKGAGTLWSCTAHSGGVVYTSGVAVFGSGSGLHTPGNLYILKNFNGSTDGGGGAMVGWYGEVGPLVIKNFQTSTQATIEAITGAIYDSKDALGLLTYSGNGLSGTSDAEWMAFNVATPQDGDTDVIAAPTLGIRNGTTIIGGANTNYTWVHKGSGVTATGSFDAYRTTTISGTIAAGDHESVVPDFFIRAVPGDSTNGINSVNAPIGKRVFLNEPRGIEKILVWSNSRGMRGNYFDAGPVDTDLFYNYPGNHAHGYVGATWSKCAGFFNSPVLDSLARRYGHDAPANPLTSGTIAQVSSGSTSYRDFIHFWTNSGRSGEGPGRGLALVSNASYVCHKARKAPGTLLDGVQGSGWKHRAHLLKFPGAASVTVSIEEAAAQSSAGTPSTIGTYNLDTTTSGPHALFGGSYTAGTRTIVIDAEVTASAGQAIYVSAGTGLHGLAEIQSVTNDLPIVGQTTIVIRHAFAINPSIVDSEFKIGPWSFQTVEHDAALPALEYQGLRIARDSVANRIAVVQALDVWALGVNGWVWGQAGWGGNGYQPQTDDGVTNLPSIICDTLDADAVFLHNATQSTTTAQRKLFADSLQPTVAASAIVYCSDQQHGTNEATSGSWADESLSQTNYPAVVGMESPLVGSGYAQYSLWQKANSAHPSFEGMYAIAQANIEQMEAWENDSAGGGNSFRDRGRGRLLMDVR